MEILVLLVCIKFPNLPIILRDEAFLKSIRDKIGHYFDIDEPKGNIYLCTRICVEMDLEKGHSEEIQLSMELWGHL